MFKVWGHGPLAPLATPLFCFLTSYIKARCLVLKQEVHRKRLERKLSSAERFNAIETIYAFTWTCSKNTAGKRPLLVALQKQGTTASLPHFKRVVYTAV